MSRLSFRPRPLDFNKKIPIVKSVKDFEDDEVPTSTRNSQTLRLTAEADNEVQQSSAKKVASEIPTPQFVVVDTYERDYSPTFTQPTSYLRARGARAEIGGFVEYDLDNEDEDWLQEFNKERKTLAAEKFETIIFKLEVLDHKARERAGVITPTLGSPIPVLLTFDAAVEALQALSIKYGVFQSIYSYWKEKTPFLTANNLNLALTPQPPPPVSDTNPYNVFRPREKAHKLHTRRMQRRENNVQSFEKLRQVRRNLDQAKTIVEALIKREEKKRELLESEITLQRIQMNYKHETQLLEESLALSGLPSFPSKLGSSEEDFDSDDVASSRPHRQPPVVQNPPFMESKRVMVPAGNVRRETRRRVPYTWLHKLDPTEPVLLFTKPLLADKLAASGIIPPLDPSTLKGTSPRSFIRGRIGRGAE
ncbi:UNVERIFIED_CONTAM: Enhancer of polycomb-like protein 1 [Sesamum latifolium]|uniref:Enhancer of polycomb-like protein n=1 Tax=Sesamum latifolium TaxID=2727402 RepID=A0AAW2UZ61_9LAMI